MDPELPNQIFLVFILIYGIYIRFSEYIANRSVWFDEASLALNVINNSIRDLLTQPLDYNQVAPIGFLLTPSRHQTDSL